MGHKQGEVVGLDPRRSIAVADSVKLADVDTELPLEAAAAELQEGTIEANNAEAQAPPSEHGREVAGQHAGLARHGAVRVAGVPRGIGGEGLVDELAVRRVGVAPKLQRCGKRALDPGGRRMCASLSAGSASSSGLGSMEGGDWGAACSPLRTG